MRVVPDLATAFMVAAEECRQAESRNEFVLCSIVEIDVHVFADGSTASEIHIPTQTEHDWGITICAWRTDGS